MLSMKNSLKGIFTAAVTDVRSQMYTSNILLYIYLYKHVKSLYMQLQE